jgi:hypothetical protein
MNPVGSCAEVSYFRSGRCVTIPLCRGGYSRCTHLGAEVGIILTGGSAEAGGIALRPCPGIAPALHWGALGIVMVTGIKRPWRTGMGLSSPVPYPRFLTTHCHNTPRSRPPLSSWYASACWKKKEYDWWKTRPIRVTDVGQT